MAEHTPRPERDDIIDAYLDDRLPPEQRAAFEREVEQSDELRAEVELARAIDDSLRRRFAPPPSIPMPRTASTERPSPLRRVLGATLAIAAVLVLAGAAAFYLFVPAPRPTTIAAPDLPQWTPTRFYEHFEDEGFEPVWVCEDQEQFHEYTTDTFAQALVPCNVPAGFEFTGWAYLPSGVRAMTAGTQVLFAEVDGDRIVVLVDRAEHARELPESDDPELKVFQREVAGLVLYEITPRDEPLAVNLLQPECP